MFVYFVLEPIDNVVKIGKVGAFKQIKTRFHNLQTANARELTMMGYVSDETGELETQLHIELRSHRIRGEWFDHSSSSVSKCVAFYIAKQGFEEVDHNELVDISHVKRMLKINDDQVRNLRRSGTLQFVVDPNSKGVRKTYLYKIGDVLKVSNSAAMLKIRRQRFKPPKGDLPMIEYV